jgi:hypothetical protein
LDLPHEVELTPFSIVVDCGRLRAFAAATGQDDPVYSDPAAAQTAGHPSLPVPPTFLFCLEMDGPEPMETFERLGIDYSRVLHGEQHFGYHRLTFAGETLRFVPRITDQYWKKGGSLRFLVRETRVEGSDGAAVADLRSVFVVLDAGRLSSTIDLDSSDRAFRRSGLETANSSPRRHS